MRTPPIASRKWHTWPIYVFEKHGGELERTFIVRIVHRVPNRSRMPDGADVHWIRYDGWCSRIYPPESFRDRSKAWVRRGDSFMFEREVYRSFPLPLKHWFMFDIDQPLGRCGQR